jgi:hypothetical protein
VEYILNKRERQQETSEKHLFLAKVSFFPDIDETEELFAEYPFAVHVATLSRLTHKPLPAILGVIKSELLSRTIAGCF